jgi:fluoride exporter
MMLEKLLWMGLAGALGVLARYGLTGLTHRLYPGGFPLGTFVVNVLGCLVFGLVFGLFEAREALGSQARIVILVGFMGAFTTFSSYMYEGAELLRGGQWAWAALYLLGQNLLGFAALLGGLALARAL